MVRFLGESTAQQSAYRFYLTFIASFIARRLMAGSNKQFDKITQTIALRKRELQKRKREEKEASKKETSTEM